MKNLKIILVSILFMGVCSFSYGQDELDPGLFDPAPRAAGIGMANTVSESSMGKFDPRDFCGTHGSQIFTGILLFVPFHFIEDPCTFAEPD